MKGYEKDVADGERFEFGSNWAKLLKSLSETQVSQAERSLREMLEVPDLRGKRFLDVGSGSGLFSLAARRLGASVLSFDYDPQSVVCTQELKRRYCMSDNQWIIEEGSALDRDYLATLGKFDVVYSWGVLHHTGSMWEALDNVAPLVAEYGRLFIAIYNDQGRSSVMWRKIKKAYCAAPESIRAVMLLLALVRLWGPTTIRDVLKGTPGATARNYGKYGGRGMSPWRDVVDWVGGYPFEVAKPEEIFYRCRNKGFRLDRIRTCSGGLGCNEFVFSRC